MYNWAFTTWDKRAKGDCVVARTHGEVNREVSNSAK